MFDGADTQRFYITVLSYDLQGGVHLSRSQLAVAVSISANPADGFLGPFTMPTMGLDACGAPLSLLLESLSSLLLLLSDAYPNHIGLKGVTAALL